MNENTEDTSKFVSVETTENGYGRGVWKCPYCLRTGGTALYHTDDANFNEQNLRSVAGRKLESHVKRCKGPAPMKMKEVRILVRNLIAEMDTGMPGYGADIGTMPLTAGYGFMDYGGSLKNIFVDPFVDVFKTAKGVATDMTARAKGAAQTIVESILSSFIPLYQTNYSAIFKQMSKNVQEVKKKYAKVYEANDEAFRDKDARFLAFLYDPSAWITAKTAEAAPGAVAGVLEIFTDSASGAGTHLLEAIRYLKELEMEIKGVSRYNRNVPQRLRTQAHKNLGIMPWEGKSRGSEPLLEAENANPMTASQKLQQILSNPELKKEIDMSPTAQAMKADGQRILSTLMSKLSKDISDVASIGSLDDIQRMSQGKVRIPDMGQVDSNEQQQAEQAAVSSVKQGLSEFYKRSLQGALKQAEVEGVGNSAYARALQNLLSRVR